MPQMVFKEGVEPREFTQVDVRLKRILFMAQLIAWYVWGDDLVITSIHRVDGSTHSNPPPYRFVDVALLEQAGEAGSETLRQVINTLYPYGVAGLETIPPLDHPGTAKHLHFQVHP